MHNLSFCKWLLVMFLDFSDSQKVARGHSERVFSFDEDAVLARGHGAYWFVTYHALDLFGELAHLPIIGMYSLMWLLDFLILGFLN